MHARQRRSIVWKTLPWLIPVLIALAQLWLLAVPSAGGLLDSAAAQLGGRGLLWFGLWATAFFSTAMLLWRVVLVARYQPTPAVEDSRLPLLTVIVPAYNEGQQVLQALRSLARSDYPRARLQIVAVDDGSVDDTWLWIKQGAMEFAGLVTPVRCIENRGKRAALYEGFSRSRGEMIVTVDSDSEVLPDTLRNLVSPLVIDPSVGTVAGNVRVLNDAGPFGRMLDVTFTYAFDFMRASESMVDTVTCCPGALSAFRRDVIDQVKDEWLNQTFMGAPANIGEDRALTNLVLQLGFLSRFQSNAVVLTEVPQQLPQLCRMLLRWARSNARETLYLAGFIFSRFRRGPVLGARINFLWSAWQTVLEFALFVPLIALIATRPQLLAWGGAAVLVSGLVPAAIFASSRCRRRALWAFPYAVFSAVVLSWITPYALITVHRSGWLTRLKPASQGHEPAMELLDVESG